MGSRRGELQCASSTLLATDVGEVRQRPVRAVERPWRRRLERLVAPQVADGLAKVTHADRLDPRKRCLGGRVGRAEYALEAAPCRPLGGRDDAGDRPDRSVEPELADARVLGETCRRDLPRGREQRQDDREVEARSLLAQARRARG